MVLRITIYESCWATWCCVSLGHMVLRITIYESCFFNVCACSLRRRWHTWWQCWRSSTTPMRPFLWEVGVVSAMRVAWMCAHEGRDTMHVCATVAQAVVMMTRDGASKGWRVRQRCGCASSRTSLTRCSVRSCCHSMPLLLSVVLRACLLLAVVG